MFDLRKVIQFINTRRSIQKLFLNSARTKSSRSLNLRIMTEGTGIVIESSHRGSRSSQMSGSRITRLYSPCEVALEYSVVVIVLACFILISFSSRWLRQNSGCRKNFACETSEWWSVQWWAKLRLLRELFLRTVKGREVLHVMREPPLYEAYWSACEWEDDFSYSNERTLQEKTAGGSVSHETRTIITFGIDFSIF